MNESSGDFWMNTINAQAYSGLNDLNLGKYFFSLFIIVVILVILAWLAHKAGWIKAPAATPTPDQEQEQDQVIFYSQFTHDQTLLIVAQDKGIHCYIQKDNQTILATPLPDLIHNTTVSGSPDIKKSMPTKMTFKEIWLQVLGRNKGKRS